MSEVDEPMLEDTGGTGGDGESLGARIAELVAREPFAVLCTEGHEQPYGSVVAIAFTSDLRHALFATPVTTRKYRLLRDNQRVALVIDDRSAWGDDTMKIQAVTATGLAQRVPAVEVDALTHWARVLVERHPALEGFVRASSCALFRVDLLRYFHVERFQEVREWAPA